MNIARISTSEPASKIAQWIIDVEQIALGKQFYRYLNTEIAKGLRDPVSTLTTEMKNVILKDNEVIEWLFSILPISIRGQIYDKSNSQKSAFDFWTTMKTTLGTDRWDFAAIMIELTKKPDESYNDYFYRLTLINQLDVKKKVSIRNIHHKILSEIPVVVKNVPRFYLQTDAFLSQCSKNSSSSLTEDEFGRILSLVESINAKPNKSDINFVAEKRNNTCTNKKCLGKETHDWKTCQNTICNKCKQPGHIGPKCPDRRPIQKE